MKEYGLKIITGQHRSPIATVVRGGLSLIEPFYAAAMGVRNACYDHGLFKVHDLGRPTISVGNITTGGTGKTPVVQWLAEQLRTKGHRPSILLRGYGAAGGLSDEAQLLDQSLNQDGQTKIPIEPNPARTLGAANVLARDPGVTHFILDDAFQHRRAKRSFNLVLISATNPFGYGHVLPRGLLREPLSGLRRADAFLITRCSLVSDEALHRAEQFLSSRHPSIPIFRSDHVQPSIWFPAEDQSVPIQGVRGKQVLLTAGIGDPTGFERQLADSGAIVVARRWWPDHHAYTADEVAVVAAFAEASGAEMILTTQKDWVKMRSVCEDGMPIGVVNVEIRFHGDDAKRLLGSTMGTTDKSNPTR